MSKNLEAIKSNLNNIDQILDEYRNNLKDLETNLSTQYKRIDIAVIEQTGWYSYYDNKRVELKTIYEYIDMQLTKIHSIKWQKLTEKHSRDLTQKDKEIYIKHDPDYLEMALIVLHTKEVYELYLSAVDSFKMRGYALNNLTKLRVAQQEDWVI